MMFRFSDNRPRGFHKVEVGLTAEELARHLMNDRQFAYYYKRGWCMKDAARRSLYASPPHPKAICFDDPTPAQWEQLREALDKLEV